ncbi:hypothetical protein AJ80_07380 [Polytolypa hystricis UAMH7299]|uniref:Aminoglycoside phosphotransferase domain-containing protein n=1 Tax=Polytolypa hystricis (strain UAMH7299) TaxID=1447883 RepID=A0A2B7XPB8_POLH7|nr:hypothetical protein AJ80_07380 [Polytolypa hystricis UAMH7299]
MASRPGLRWEEVRFGVEPRWTHEPDIKAVEHIASIALARPCSVSFFCQGAFNRLYHAQCEQSAPQTDYLKRVSLLVDPKFKTLSEVATLVWIQQHTSLPVPRIVAYRLSGIGNLFFTKLYGTGDKTQVLLQNDGPAEFVLGRIVLIAEWLRARLRFNQLDCEKTIRESDDEDDVEEAEKTLPLVKRLIKATSLIFAEDSKVPTVLLHDDLSQHNILVDDDDGEFQGIIDWECTSAVPLWKAVQFPQFLQVAERVEKPMRETYSADEGGEDLLRKHLLEYEQTQLRGVFMGGNGTSKSGLGAHVSKQPQRKANRH